MKYYVKHMGKLVGESRIPMCKDEDHPLIVSDKDMTFDERTEYLLDPYGFKEAVKLRIEKRLLSKFCESEGLKHPVVVEMSYDTLETVVREK